MSRRDFVTATTVGAAAFYIGRSGFAQNSPNNKLNIGVIGVANRAAENLRGVSSENIVALCDVDDTYLAAAHKNHPGAALHSDFRKMLEKEKLDAVVVSTTDHTHAVATVAALRKGCHVYCEKPLTHTISEARAVAKATRESGRVTQMGTQIHAGENYRRVVELVKTGAIGAVREVHNWTGATWSGANRPTPNEQQPAGTPKPPHLHWDLWLGPAAAQPYNPLVVPRAWRGYWAFGGGAMADMACHHMDLSFWALDLTAPLTVEAEGPAVHPVHAPDWLVVRYEFPGRGVQPPVRLTWYNGGKRPDHFDKGALPKWGDGTLFVGEKGMLLADYGRHLLLPAEKFADYQKPAPFIPASVGHHQEWISACKTNGVPSCNFDYGARLTETALLGNVAFRTGKKIHWDAVTAQVLNAPEAAQYLNHQYRAGWSI